MTNSDEKNICGSTETESGDPCRRPAGWGTSHVGEGRCTDHPGRGAPKGNQNAVGNSGGGPPEGNQNASVHGLYADTNNYYQDLSDDHQRFVNFHYWGFLADAPFDDTNPKAGVLFEIAVNHHKRLSADGTIAVEGMSETKPVPGSDGLATETKEHHLHLAYDRLARTDIRRLKELDVLDSPDSRQADALEDGLDLELSIDDKDALEAAFDTES